MSFVSRTTVNCRRSERWETVEVLSVKKPNVSLWDGCTALGPVSTIASTEVGVLCTRRIQPSAWESERDVACRSKTGLAPSDVLLQVQGPRCDSNAGLEGIVQCGRGYLWIGAKVVN